MENSFLDTLINILVFVFIGWMIWLYLQDSPKQE
jgi:hypothetical protein